MSIPKIRYTSKDYQTILDNIIEIIPQLTPDWTDFNESDLGMVIVELFCGVADMLGYYIDHHANENFLPTALLRQSIIDLVQLIDYQLSRPASAYTTLRFYVDSPAGSPITIPAWLNCKLQSGTYFVTTAEGIINTGETECFIGAYEGLIKEVSIGVNGNALQEYALPDKNISKNMFTVFVNGVEWVEDEGQALDPSNYNVYKVLVDWEGNAKIQFSTRRGNVPNVGDSVVVKYLQTLGKNGNLTGTGQDLTIYTLVGGLENVRVKNYTPAIGGADAESTEAARELAPMSIRALHRAVTAEDYEYFARRFGGVVKARAVQGVPSWKNVSLYVAPTNGDALTSGVANNIIDYFENKKDPTVSLQVYGHTFVDVILTVDVNIKKNASRSNTRAAIIQAIDNYFSFENQDFGGRASEYNPEDKGVFISDLYKIITAIPDVGKTEITELKKKISSSPDAYSESALSLTFGDFEIPRLETNGLTLNISGGVDSV